MRPLSRRGFLKVSAGAVMTAALLPHRLEGGLFDHFFGATRWEMTLITPNDQFYLTSIRSNPQIRLEDWTLEIKGLVRQPLKLTYDDLLKRPQTTMISTLECVGNPIGGDSMGAAKWEAVKLNSCWLARG